MNGQELSQKIISVVRDFLNDQFVQRKVLKTKKELTFSEKQLKEIVEKIMEYYGINSNNINIFNDKIEFRFDYDFGTVFGIYHETRYIRLFFEKRNNMLKLTKIELEK